MKQQKNITTLISTLCYMLACLASPATKAIDTPQFQKERLLYTKAIKALELQQINAYQTLQNTTKRLPTLSLFIKARTSPANHY